MFGDPEWGHLDVFDTTAQRIEVADVLDAARGRSGRAFTTAEFLAACHEHGVAAGPVHSAADLFGWEHLHARSFFEPIQIADDHYRADVLVPGPAWRFHDATPAPGADRYLVSATPARLTARHGHDPPSGRRRSTAACRARPSAPLAGVRVVDLTWVWAGPYSAMQLAHLGAEVVKVESSERVDVTRVLGPWADGEVGLDRSGYFNQYNQGKQGIVLDLKQPPGASCCAALVAKADVLIDNMRAGALDRMGFSYEALRQLNPRIVAVSMTGFGESGPERDRMAYGSLIDALSGVAVDRTAPSAAARPTSPCRCPTPAPASTPPSPRWRRCTGRGPRGRVHGSSARCWKRPSPPSRGRCSTRSWPAIGRPSTATETRRRAPHDVYRCAGDYEWVAIAVEDDAQFAALAAAMGRPELVTGPPLRDPAGAAPPRRRARCHAVGVDGRPGCRRRRRPPAGRGRAGRAGAPHQRPVRLGAAARPRRSSPSSTIRPSAPGDWPAWRGGRHARRWWRPRRRRVSVSTPTRCWRAGSACRRLRASGHGQ